MNKIIKWIVEDIRSDIKFLKSIGDGTYKLPPKLRKELKETSIKKLWLSLFKDKWFWISAIVFLLAFSSGYIWGEVINHNMCVDYINENIMPLLQPEDMPFLNMSLIPGMS